MRDAGMYGVLEEVVAAARRLAGNDAVDYAERVIATHTCVVCGVAPVRMGWADTCLECAEAGCHGMSERAWTTTAKGRYAFAYRTKEETLQTCPHCCGDQWISYTEERDHFSYQFTKPCPGLRLDHRIGLFNAAKLPGNLHSATFDGFKTEDNPALRHALDQSRDWARTVAYPAASSRGLSFTGGNGLGKTHLLAAITRTLTMARGMPVMYIDWAELVRQLQSAPGETKSPAEVLNPYEQVPCLILDELGKTEAREWRIDALESLIEARYSAFMTVTCVSSNFFGNELRDRIGPRAFSRLKAMCDPIVLHGEDWRERR